MKIVDTLNRPLRDLRISVIDQCNLRCTYCMPAEIFGSDFAFLPASKLLTFEEIERLVKSFTALGVEKIRLTGGEPLLRKNVPQLIENLLKIEGVQDLSLTTNGILLGSYAKRLKDAGLQRINVSLDSLDSATYGKMNGRKFPVDRVLQSIEKAASEGIHIKINMVVQKGVNDQDVVSMAKYCFEKGYTLRFIEYMDVGNTNGWKLDQVYSSREILAKIQEEMPLEPIDPNYMGEVAKRYRYIGTDREIGFISSVTEAFCSTCNRARISADGKLYTCLFASKGVSLIEKLRHEKLSDQALQTFLSNIWHNRDDRYSELRTELDEEQKQRKIEMSYIGG